MTTYNFCKRMDKTTRIAIDRWARLLEAEEVTIHKNGTVTLTCAEGIICERYAPTAKELSRK